jgi:hypothetical protein
VATFYLLPPRPLLGERIAQLLMTLLPGVCRSRFDGTDLTELLTRVLAGLPETYVVHREDLADDEDTSTALRHGFGAEPGDEVVEVRPGGREGEFSSRQWRIN